MNKPSIAAVCTNCKTTYKLGTRSCPRCNKGLTHFKARIKTPYGWLTRQSADLGEIQTFIQEASSRVAAMPRPEKGASPAAALLAESMVSAGLTLGDVWRTFLPWAMENLRSWESYETMWRLRLEPHLGALPLPAITSARLYDVLDGMRKHSPGSRQRVRALASRLFTFARRRLGYRGENPVQFLEVERFDNTRRRVLSLEESERLLAVLKTWPNRRAALLILFLYHTGRRRGECRKLTWDRVDLERGVVTFDAATTKSKRTNVVPVSLEAWDILREAHGLGHSNRDDLVFPAMTGRYAWHLENTWAIIRKKASLEDVKLHDLRRTWISRTLARGVGAFLVKDLVGHEHIQTTQRYVNLDMRALEQAVRP